MSRIFGAARQLGIVVRDFDATLRYWAEVHGIGPFYCIREAPMNDYRYRGEPSEEPIVSLAFGYQGDLQIEVITQHNDAPSCYLDFLASGREGPHHLCGWATSEAEYDATYAKANQAGLKAVHEGQMGGTRFSYFETIAPGGLYAELSEGGAPGPFGLFERVREASIGWDGSNPIRAFEELL